MIIWQEIRWGERQTGKNLHLILKCNAGWLLFHPGQIYHRPLGSFLPKRICTDEMKPREIFPCRLCIERKHEAQEAGQVTINSQVGRRCTFEVVF